ncbi:serine protease [Acuticoccus sp. M5D2P5]|uniref:trypsin-like serine peptidase n=1 Tax=Acuticoccus kalidii TaxID=2910977 RepID=UPI001F2C355D|nr:serine protease [Acuticoccus kalidii]MCF3934265.1 serine protease [Acuticoccus kalidii]
MTPVLRAAVAAFVTLAPLATIAKADPNLAVGRANHAGYDRQRHCTMFAIAPRVAITASHCLRGLDAAQMQLLFGYDRMGWALHTNPTRAVDLGRDVTALCLAQDAPATLAIGEADGAETVDVIGYARRRQHAQTDSACRIVSRDRDKLLLDCPQDPGTSGGPVLGADGGVIAMMSATARDASFAVRLPAGAAEACR